MMTRETTSDRILDAVPTTGGECKRALKKLEQIVIEGLRHGFFECTVACDIIKGEKRRLLIKAGVSHQFIIPMEEIGN